MNKNHSLSPREPVRIEEESAQAQTNRTVPPIESIALCQKATIECRYLGRHIPEGEIQPERTKVYPIPSLHTSALD